MSLHYIALGHNQWNLQHTKLDQIRMYSYILPQQCSLFNFLHSTIISIILEYFQHLFPNTFNLSTSLGVRDFFSHPYKTGDTESIQTEMNDDTNLIHWFYPEPHHGYSCFLKSWHSFKWMITIQYNYGLGYVTALYWGKPDCSTWIYFGYSVSQLCLLTNLRTANKRKDGNELFASKHITFTSSSSSNDKSLTVYHHMTKASPFFHPISIPYAPASIHSLLSFIFTHLVPATVIYQTTSFLMFSMLNT
jgi:hypothetical protein